MSVTVFTAPNPTFPRPKHPKPWALAETASLLAVSFARLRLKRVLLLSGTGPGLVEKSEIRHKPGAIRVITECQGWPEVRQEVKEFCLGINNPTSRGYLMGVRNQPVVIINDVDYFLAEASSDGCFTQTCDPKIVQRVNLLDQMVQIENGDLLLMAVLPSTAIQWTQLIEQQGWNWKPHNQWQSALVTSANELQSAVQDPSRHSTQRTSESGWYHQPGEDPPEQYAHGPLVGSQMQLAAWMSNKGKADRRRLASKAKSGVVWVRKINRYEYEVWFKSDKDYSAANGQKMIDKHSK